MDEQSLFPGSSHDQRKSAIDLQSESHTHSKPSSKPEIIDRALSFISTASNETLLACLAGLGAITYFVLGRVGLVLIGVVGGIALHATWEGSIDQGGDASTRNEVRKRREVGLEVTKRLLAWKEGGNTEGELHIDNSEVDIKLSMRTPLDFNGLPPATQAALTTFVNAVIRDYVKWWYGPILPDDETFPFASRQTLTAFLLKLSSHLSHKRPADTFLNFLTNSISTFIVFLSELSNALMVPNAAGLDALEAVNIYLEEHPESNLATMTSQDQQTRKYKAVAEDILETFLDAKSYNCEPVRTFLREVLAGLILETTVKSCSRPEWINGWIVYLLEEGEPELLSAIDAGVEAAPAKELKKAVAMKDLNGNAVVQGNSMNSERGNSEARASHQRKVSMAEEAMEEAMREAKRMNEMIAAEDAKKTQEVSPSSSSGQNTASYPTPTSSQSDLRAEEAVVKSPIEESETQILPATGQEVAAFTSFDQILDTTTNGSSLRQTEIQPLTLHNASVTIFDDAMPGDKSSIKAKPNIDYLLQIEPASSQHGGWMIARKYADFETLHEILRRISVVSGVTAFSTKYSALPPWKGRTKDHLRIDLEKYCRDALSFDLLAESEGMKRFLEKDQGSERPQNTPNKGVLGFPSPAAFENMGKGMLDVLASAPKGAAGGGKALLGGVSGVFQKKTAIPTKSATASRPGSISNFAPSPGGSQTMLNPLRNLSKSSMDINREPSKAQTETDIPPALPTRLSMDLPSRQTMSRRTTISSNELPISEESSVVENPWQEQNNAHELSAKNQDSEMEFHLPPPPSEISDDYGSNKISSATTSLNTDVSLDTSAPDRLDPAMVASPQQDQNTLTEPQSTDSPSSSPEEMNRKPKREVQPLSTQETQVAVELFFALINELYTLSSAWSIRRSLLNAARTFLLRPGNPNLEAIRVLIQDTVIEANSSDVGIATHILKTRENALPTEEELKAWPPKPSAEEKEKLRVKARKLLVEKGMPQALTSVMGASASGEALGRVFDCLQVEEVARGLMFALLLQGVRAMTH
ncbi:hypothetical protein MMC25_004554 [Agyrium rufum]|nr:hypothetical protein [Agyrium rufum]